MPEWDHNYLPWNLQSLSIASFLVCVIYLCVAFSPTFGLVKYLHTHDVAEGWRNGHMHIPELG